MRYLSDIKYMTTTPFKVPGVGVGLEVKHHRNHGELPFLNPCVAGHTPELLLAVADARPKGSCL